MRREQPKNVKRRADLCRLARRVTVVGHRRFPTFPSSSALRAGLFRSTGEMISARHVRRILRSAGHRSYRRRLAPTRTQQDAAARRAFAKKHKALARRIVFTDESWMCCNERTSDSQWARRRQDVLPRERKARWNVPSIMVWGAVGYNYKSKLVVFPAKRCVDGELKPFRLDAEAYVRRCLSTVVADIKERGMILQHDGARSHVATRVCKYLDRKGLQIGRAHV